MCVVVGVAMMVVFDVVLVFGRTGSGKINRYPDLSLSTS